MPAYLVSVSHFFGQRVDPVVATEDPQVGHLASMSLNSFLASLTQQLNKLECLCVTRFQGRPKPAGNTVGESITTVDLLFDWIGLVCFGNKNKKMSVVIQLIPNQSNRRSMVQ
jgi:hypothetical protein